MKFPESLTIDALNKLMILANRMAWTTIVVGTVQYEEGKKLTHSNAVPNYNVWNMVKEHEFDLEIVKGNFLGIKP